MRFSDRPPMRPRGTRELPSSRLEAVAFLDGAENQPPFRPPSPARGGGSGWGPTGNRCTFAAPPPSPLPRAGGGALARVGSSTASLREGAGGRPASRAGGRPHRFATRAICAALATLLFWMPASQVVYAQDPEGEHAGGGYPSSAQLRDDVAAAVERDLAEGTVREGLGVGDPSQIAPAAEGAPVDAPASIEDPSREPISLPGGASASAVTPQAISLPNAEGSVEGMGESFSPVLSSGTATFSVPIAVAPGRAGVQPSLALSYSTTGGNGPVGFGWNLGVPFISRQTDRGLPRYIDQPAWHGQEDRFMYNGGQELVPVDDEAIGVVDGQANGGTPPAIPSELAGWQQYRARVEGGFMRFFRSRDSERWVVQSKDGTRFDFGRVASGAPPEITSGSSRALERDPERTSGGVYRWCLTRMSDPHGSTVYYLYDQHGGHSYLSEVYYVSPATCASTDPSVARSCATSLAGYGARVRLVYEARSDVFSNYVAGWRIDTARRLKRVEVTAHDDDEGARTLVRRYHLSYASDSFHSLLQQVRVEGRPHSLDTGLGANVGDRGVRESTLGDGIVGELLPPMTFRYSPMPSGGIPGFGTISSRVLPVVNSPPHSVDEGRADLFDVNSDGLPDLIVTDPARYRTAGGGPAVGVFFNGFTGGAARPAGSAAHFSGAVPMGMRSDLSSVLNLSNLNVVPMDIDGDGRSDLLHMPRLRSYGWWAPTRRTGTGSVSPAQQGWEWTYAQVDLPAGDTDPRIDLGRDSSHIRVLDVNNDHLIDVVRTTGTVMQTWVNLGWLPGGDGRFGSYTWNGSEYELSTEPFESCLLQGGTPIDFDDPEVRLADMNGDGLQDIAQIRRGRVIYWPGRGEGVWGEGSRSCSRGEGAGRYIEMATPPAELAIDLDGVFLEDVNMDGAADLVQVRFREVDVWFNRAGGGWTGRTTIRGTPATPSFAPRIRFADIDGSGTTDLVWGNAHAWEYVDLVGGQRPRLLVGVDNGLGADTTITYDSSARDYLEDLQAADTGSGADRFTWSHEPDGPDARLCALSRLGTSPQCNAAESSRAEWLIRSSGSPVISTVVRGVSTTDRFDVLGREAQVTESQFAYHDGYYEGIEQEFRGFGAADAVTIGDWNNPTVYSRTHFLQGRRPHSIADDRLEDNPDEALKGREVMTEVFDEEGRFLTTSWATITNRYLLTGLDGRAIHYAFVNETNELRYDHSPYAPNGATFTAPAVVREAVDPSDGELGDANPHEAGVQLAWTQQTRTIAIRGQGAARVRATFDAVDNLGHVLQQTAHGQVALSDAAAIDGRIVSHTEPLLIGDGASWIWRTGRTSVTGHGASSTLGDTTNAYNAVGDLILATQIVSGDIFAFGGEDPSEGGASAYPNAAPPHHEDLVASTVYDEWGNARASCAGHDLAGAETFTTACLRFGSVVYDTRYEQLATIESLRVRPGTPGPTSVLTYAGTWDRGLGAIRSSTDPNGLTTSVTYDGLGRLTSVVAPNVDGCSGATPSTRIAYELTSSPTTQPISRVVTTTELDCDGALGEDGGALVSIAYVDGLGRARAALSTGEDASGARQWVRSGITTLDKKGTVRRTYQTDYFGGSPTAYAAVVALPADIPYAVTRYDAFGRAKGVHAEDGAVTWTSYHALSTDVCDPLDNDPSSEHFRTCTSARTDGHGRVVDQILRNRSPATGAAETYRLWTYYRADGAVLALVRTEAPTSTPRAPSATDTAATGVVGLGALPSRNVVRTFTYDTVGRRLSSDDPDTDNPADPSEATNSWRYLFNRVGDLVAVRDPRGCGQNFLYDFGGRLTGEQYVSCGEAQSHAAERPSEDNRIGDLIAMTYSASEVALDVVYHYDEYPDWATGPTSILPSTASGVRGRATGVSDRGQRAVLAYDDRGNVTWTARQMALISDALVVTADSLLGPAPPADTETAPAPGEVRYDEAHTYTRTASFDHAGRPVSMALPRDPDDAAAPLVTGALTYNRRGLPASASASIGGVTHPIVHAIEYLRDGLVASITYGDDHGGTRARTVSTTTYDIRRRPIRFRTERDATGGAPESLAAVTLPVDQRLVWDAANNLVAQIDDRDAGEWPAGHRPQSVNIRHDALYRVVGADFDYTQPGGARALADDATDWRTGFAATRPHDPMRQEPAPMASRLPGGRVHTLTWTWDYLANTTEWTDDAESFYERSIGAITNGDDDATATLRPSALYVASNVPETDEDLSYGGAGWVEVDYGAGGNVRAMTVHAQCGHADLTDRCVDDPEAARADRAAALRRGCACSVEQHYVYRWDELNRLDEARRYDRSGGGPWELEVRQRYRYDAANVRTVKQTLDQDGCGGAGAPCERTALYVYPGDFERRGLVRGFDAYEADETLRTETQYVVAGARTVWRSTSPEPDYDRDHRLTVALTDLIQTTAAVLDVRTGELLEASTYYPNGARETYLVDGATATAPEVAGFTGKEGDEEVGVVYFGERYLIPRIGRWASPDPLHVHECTGGETLNAYHYVAGNVLQNRDPIGLNALPPPPPRPPPRVVRTVGGGGSGFLANLRAQSTRAQRPSMQRSQARVAAARPNLRTARRSQSRHRAEIGPPGHSRPPDSVRVADDPNRALFNFVQSTCAVPPCLGAALILRIPSTESTNPRRAPAERREANERAAGTDPPQTTPPASAPPAPAGGGDGDDEGGSGRRPELREFDIDRYGNFNTPERRGDSLAGHEMLQNAWLRAHGYTSRRGTGPASRDNPAVALSPELHARVGREQAARGLNNPATLRQMSAQENIEANAEAMLAAGVPAGVVRSLQREAESHAAQLPTPQH